jgi:hypothetical protein
MTNGYLDDFLQADLGQMATMPPTPELQPVADIPW